MYCGKCGKKIVVIDAEFCNSCGRKLTKINEPHKEKENLWLPISVLVIIGIAFVVAVIYVL